MFGTLDTRPGFVSQPDDRKLSDEVMDYWTNFAKTGDPNGGGQPEWPRYDKTGEVMHLDADSTSDSRYNARTFYFLQGIPADPH